MQSARAFYGTIASISAACVALFCVLAWQLQTGGGMVRVDEEVALRLHSSAGPWGIFALKLITFFGDFAALTTLAIIAGALLLRARAHGLAAGWLGAMIGTGVFNEILKRAFARPRPSFAEPIATVGGFSFPSGHSMGTMVAVSMLAYAAFRWVQAPKWRRITIAFAAIWTLTMGFSRMYLGVHYLSDVIAGFAAGGAWSCACMAVLEVVRRRNVAPTA
jgi:membrane-associated phospholipid phosphatase